MDSVLEQSRDSGGNELGREMRLGLAIKEVRSLVFEFHSGGGRNCAVRFSMTTKLIRFGFCSSYNIPVRFSY